MKSKFGPPNIDLTITGAREALSTLDELSAALLDVRKTMLVIGELEDSLARVNELITKLRETPIELNYSTDDEA